jgi:hypothetical protein
VSIPANPSATETFAPAKLFGDRRAELPARDLGDPDQVFALAVEIAGSSDRRLMQVSLDELRALAALAASAAPVASLAARTVRLSDANAPRQEMQAALASLMDAARRLAA